MEEIERRAILFMNTVYSIYIFAHVWYICDIAQVLQIHFLNISNKSITGIFINKKVVNADKPSIELNWHISGKQLSENGLVSTITLSDL